MEAHEIPISDFLKMGKSFIIPVYQRNYDWRRKQCQQLLKDIDAMIPGQLYFIGSVVHKKKSDLLTQPELIIIDGQQRITTITLFLLRIAKIFKENDDRLHEQIWDDYIQNKYANDEEKLKLKPIISDNEIFKTLVNGNAENLDNGNRILDNYLFFKEKITSYEQAKKLYENFKNLTIVQIALSSIDDPQKIFQSLNSTGLELSQADLIRNYLLMNLDYGEQETIFNNYWSIIEKNCLKISLNESKLSLFFRDYLTLKFGSIPSYSNTFEKFKERYPDINQDREVFEKELGEMKKYSSFYSLLINPELEKNAKIAKELRNLDKIEVTVSYPFLLAVLNDYHREKIDEETLLGIIKLIQSFVFRRFICGAPTSALNKILMTLHNNASKIRKKNREIGYIDSLAYVLTKYSSYQRFPTDEEIVETLKNKDIYSTQSKNKLYLLERLENEYDGFNENEVDFFDNEKISIEHVFPQNPSSEWKRSLSKEEFAEMEARKNTLANLTIVINNGSLGNKAFTIKRDLDQENSKGYKYSKFKLNDFLSRLNKWNLKNLNKRSTILTEKFINIWKYPEVPIIEQPSDIEIELSEIEETRGKKMKYYLLNGVKGEEKNYISMYKDTLRYLYSDHYDKLFSPEVKEIFDISRDEETFSNPIQIESGYCVEGRLSSTEIISRLKKLLNIMEEEIDLRVSFEEKRE